MTAVTERVNKELPTPLLREKMRIVDGGFCVGIGLI